MIVVEYGLKECSLSMAALLIGHSKSSNYIIQHMITMYINAVQYATQTVVKILEYLPENFEECLLSFYQFLVSLFEARNMIKHLDDLYTIYGIIYKLTSIKRVSHKNIQ